MAFLTNIQKLKRLFLEFHIVYFYLSIGICQIFSIYKAIVIDLNFGIFSTCLVFIFSLNSRLFHILTN